MTGDTDYMRLLPGESIKAIGRLELLARTPKEGFVTGRHRSPNKDVRAPVREKEEYWLSDQQFQHPDHRKEQDQHLRSPLVPLPRQCFPQEYPLLKQCFLLFSFI